ASLDLEHLAPAIRAAVRAGAVTHGGLSALRTGDHVWGSERVVGTALVALARRRPPLWYSHRGILRSSSAWSAPDRRAPPAGAWPAPARGAPPAGDRAEPPGSRRVRCSSGRHIGRRAPDIPPRTADGSEAPGSSARARGVPGRSRRPRTDSIPDRRR